MSYTSESKLSIGVKLPLVQDVIGLLGYKKTNEKLDIPNWVAGYYWYEEADYQSWAGVELDIYRDDHEICIATRSRSCRSYWDLIQQKKR